MMSSLELILKLLSDDNPSVDSLDLNATTILEDGSASTLTATISAAHSKNIIIPLTITGTASQNDYSTDFSSKGPSIVVGGNGQGSELNQVKNDAKGISVDTLGNVYVADWNNSRIVKWTSGSSEGVNIIDYAYRPMGFDMDSDGNIYIAHYYWHTVAKFSLSNILATSLSS